MSPQTPWSEAFLERAAKVRLVVLDVDGVLTDGGLYLDDDSRQAKRFFVRDGLGLRLLIDSGVAVGLITGRKSQLVDHRAQELRLSFCHQGVDDKWPRLETELKQRGLDVTACAYMGDDLIDLGILSRVGLAAAPADAVPEVRDRVHWTAPRGGGRGAVRDLAEGILRAQGRWEGLVEGFL